MGISDEDSYIDRDFQNAIHALTRNTYNEKCVPGTVIAREVGNMYTGSLYGGILSLIMEREAEQLVGEVKFPSMWSELTVLYRRAKE